MNLTQKQQVALSLFRAGMRLTLLRGKKPYLKSWQHNPIDEHMLVNHNDNFGVICGYGFFVLDVDDIDAFIHYCTANGVQPPHTYTVQSRKGFHYYLRYPQGIENLSNSNRVAGFADIRSKGGQVVAEGGVHPLDPNVTYTCINPVAIAACPDWIAQLVQNHITSATQQRGETLVETDDDATIHRAIQYLAAAEPAVEGESGDHTTFTVAARLRDFGLSETKALELMLEIYNEKCSPPWMPEEMQRKVANVYQYAQGAQGAANPVANFMLAGYTEATPNNPAQPMLIVQQPEQPQQNTAGIDPYLITVGVGYGKNHTENAARFLQEWYPGGTLRRFKEDWYYYDGKSWVLTSEDAMRRGMATAMMACTPSMSEVNGSLGIAGSLVTQQGEMGSFNGRDTANLVLLQNGILDVATGILEQHNRDFFSTNILPFSFEANAVCPTWDAFLLDIFENDPERVRFVQEWLGYMMVRDYSYQKIALFIGVQRSGKTTISNIAKRLVGSTNYMGLGLEAFAHDGTLEGALDKTVLWVNDAGTISGPNRSAIVDRLKTISGAGELSVARKWKSPFTGLMPGRISITCNNLLHFQDDSGALAGRFIICPFNRSFFGREDPSLETRLLRELPGIANRCITALRDLRARGGFIEPGAAWSEREDLQYRYSPVLGFIDSECEVRPDGRVHNEELYARFRAWCARHGNKVSTYRVFIDAMRSALRGQAEKRPVHNHGVQRQGFKGLALKEVDAEPNVTQLFSAGQQQNGGAA